MPPRFHLNYFDPPPELERYVLTMFDFAWDSPEITDKQPGAVGQLVLFPHGKGSMEFGGDAFPVTGESHMLAGFSVAAPYTVDGPWHAVGASLSPLGWAALTGKPAYEYVDRFFDPAEILGPEWTEFASRTNSAYRAGILTGQQAGDAMAQWIIPRLKPVPARHEKLVDDTLGWLGSALNPSIEDLLPRLSYSRRQAERLVERYFGFPPAAVARKYRAVRAAALLSQPDLTDHEEAMVAEAFYDQPHMVREIRRYCGHTPSRLGGPANPILQTMLRMKNFDRLKLVGRKNS